MKTYGEWMYRSTYSWSRHLLEMSGQLHAPAALPPEKEPPYALDRRLGGPQNRCGRHGEDKNPARVGNQISAAQPVAHHSPTAPSQLPRLNGVGMRIRTTSRKSISIFEHHFNSMVAAHRLTRKNMESNSYFLVFSNRSETGNRYSVVLIIFLYYTILYYFILYYIRKCGWLMFPMSEFICTLARISQKRCKSIRRCCYASAGVLRNWEQLRVK
jgi:hypothetical protein